MATEIKSARDALEQIHELLSIGGNPDTAMCIRYETANQIARNALALPRRNCEVGTAEEQDKRFDAFCKSYKEHHGNCFGCAALEKTSGDCKVSWMRMPCEKGGAE